MAADRFYAYRRNLPHWRMTGSYYFVTWRLISSQHSLTMEERNLVASAIKHFDGKRYKLCGYVVMDDHCHAVIQPIGSYTVQAIMHSWKSFTAHGLQRQFERKGVLWQREYFDRIIRQEEEFWEKIQYMLNNPLKRWPDVTAYPFAEWFPLG